MNDEWPFGRLGDSQDGEIEILAGATPEMLAETPHLALRRDAVRFPDGSAGSYLSLHNGSENAPGVAMLARYRHQFIVMRIYRHALRKWMEEIPRGTAHPGEPLEQAARRELEEELGVAPLDLRRLGCLAQDSAIIAYEVAVFLCTLDRMPERAGDYFDTQPLLLDAAEIKAGFASGRFSDPFLAYGLLTAESAGLL
jgi:ADP-ribose pyrophosphatase